MDDLERGIKNKMNKTKYIRPTKLYIMVKKIYKILGNNVWQEHLTDLGKKDKLHEFYSNKNGDSIVTLQQEWSNKFSLLDGDSSCSWCFNTFDKEYAFKTKPEIIAKRIKHELLVNQPLLRKQDEDENKRKEKLFRNSFLSIIDYLPKTIKSEHILAISPINREKIKHYYNFARFSKKNKMAQLELKSDGQYDDLWLKGRCKVKTRHRWVKSEYNPVTIAKTIKMVLK